MKTNILFSEPQLLSVGEFKKLTGFSWSQISNLTRIPTRTLTRYNQREKAGKLIDTPYYQQIQSQLALIYKVQKFSKLVS